MEPKEVTVLLDQSEAEKFILFQQYFDVFNILLESHVFEQKGATITLDFDRQGYLRNIKRNDVLYVHGSSLDNTNPSVS